jgi:hypothetical protein
MKTILIIIIFLAFNFLSCRENNNEFIKISMGYEDGIEFNYIFSLDSINEQKLEMGNYKQIIVDEKCYRIIKKNAI